MNPLPDFDAWAGAADRLGLKRKGGELAGPCPVCGGADRLHVRRRAGSAAALAGCRHCSDGKGQAGRVAFGAIVRAAFPNGSVSGACSFPDTNIDARETNTADPEEARRMKAARSLWARSGPAEDSPAAVYLRARMCWPPAGDGFPSIPPDVHWIRAARWPGDLGPLPGEAGGAILFAFRRDPDGELRAVSIEALCVDGERLAHRWRRTVGAKRGAWFCPNPSGGSVQAVVVEGEADALAACLMLPDGGEARAYGGASGLAAAVLPGGGRGCLVLPDGDGPGRDAARALRKRYPALAVDWRREGDPAGDLMELVTERAAGILERGGRDPAGELPADTLAAAWRSVLAWQAVGNPCPTAGAGIVQGASMPCTGRGAGRE